MDDDVVQRTALFAALDADAAQALRASMTPLRVVRGDTVFAEGEPGDRLFVVVEGKVKLGQTSVDGRENLLAVLGPGEMFGELSLFDPGERTSTATALTDVMLLGLGQRDLRPWLTGRPEVAAELLQALAQRLRRTNEAMSDLVFSDVPGRVAKALLELSEKFGTPVDGGILVAPVGPPTVQNLVVGTKRKGVFEPRTGMGCVFVKLVGSEAYASEGPSDDPSRHGGGGDAGPRP